MRGPACTENKPPPTGDLLVTCRFSIGFTNGGGRTGGRIRRNGDGGAVILAVFDCSEVGKMCPNHDHGWFSIPFIHTSSTPIRLFAISTGTATAW